MKTKLLALGLLSSTLAVQAQQSPSMDPNNPAVNSWLINTNSTTGKYYVSGSSVLIQDTAKANVQLVQYSTNYSYIHASGIPSYAVGPYLDGNPAQATNNAWTYKIPLSPVEDVTGAKTSTPFGSIGIFINGVAMYDYKDGGSYSQSQGKDIMGGGDGVWNRNAVMAEMDGFDCSKGHPSPIMSGGPPQPGQSVGGNYHHHQNPSAFNLDLQQVSTVCNLYASDGLYVIDSTAHSPLIGYAFDGFPVYGPYGYANSNGTGGIKRMQSAYQLRNITQRTTDASGNTVTAGPAVSTTYPLGWYREDFEFVSGSGDLDEHNGRFCVTPEYPNGTYAYFATVDANWNSAYPYLVGPTYYGEVVTDNFTASPGTNSVVISEPVTNYTPSGTSVGERSLEETKLNIFPNPAGDMVAVQVAGIVREDMQLELFDVLGRRLKSATLVQGSTIWYVDTRDLYSGEYVLRISTVGETVTKKLLIQH